MATKRARRPTSVDPSLCVQALRMRRAAHRVSKWAPGGQADEGQAARNRATALADLLMEAEGLRRLLDEPGKRPPSRRRAAMNGAPTEAEGAQPGDEAAQAEEPADPNGTPALPL